MTVVNEAQAFTKAVLGQVVSKAYTPLVVETKTLFTVSGLVLITSITGLVTTAITVANTVKLTANPTTGTATDLCTATDLGTTDTPAGNLLALPAAVGSAMASGIGTIKNNGGINTFVAAGTIEQITATGADGGITWYLTYVPIAADAVVSAA
jgi:hypothetical protein